jgi:hypothetical protein
MMGIEVLVQARPWAFWANKEMLGVEDTLGRAVVGLQGERLKASPRIYEILEKMSKSKK